MTAQGISVQVPEVDQASQCRHCHTDGYGIGALYIEFEPALLIAAKGLNK
jgi:hypothetical protein